MHGAPNSRHMTSEPCAVDVPGCAMLYAALRPRTARKALSGAGSSSADGVRYLDDTPLSKVAGRPAKFPHKVHSNLILKGSRFPSLAPIFPYKSTTYAVDAGENSASFCQNFGRTSSRPDSPPRRQPTASSRTTRGRSSSSQRAPSVLPPTSAVRHHAFR